MWWFKWGFKRTPQAPFSPCLLPSYQDVKLSAISPAPCLPACLPACHHDPWHNDNELMLRNCMQTLNLMFSFIRVVFDMIYLHSHTINKKNVLRCFYILISSIYLWIYLCCVYMHAIMCVWRLQNNLLKSILSLYHMSPRLVHEPWCRPL